MKWRVVTSILSPAASGALTFTMATTLPTFPLEFTMMTSPFFSMEELSLDSRHLHCVAELFLLIFVQKPHIAVGDPLPIVG